MKKVLFALVIAVLAFPLGAALSADDLAEHPQCEFCGMDRAKFAHSRMIVKYADGSSTGICSIRDAALDLAVKIDGTPSDILVGDYNTKELIDAGEAVWVMGGDVKGVMTATPKWAFKEKAHAQEFIKEHGGEIITFEEALKAAYEDMYKDTKMIRKKRSMKKMKQM